MSEKLRRDTLGIAEEAADWLIALKSADTEAKTAFVKWLRASPRHVEEFLLITASDQAMQGLEASRRMDVNGMISQLAGNVVPLEGAPRAPSPASQPPTQQKRKPSWQWFASGAAVAAGIVLVAGWLLGYFSAWETYTTAVGEQRTVQLTDGSLIYLNARSRADVRYSDDRRDIRLVDGEALFKVARDALRPFRVETDRAVIRAVGTQFNVDRRRHDTRVTVIEGAVEVTMARETPRTVNPSPTVDAEGAALPAQLAAGEEIRIESDGGVTRSSGNVDDAIAWRQRRLIFSDSTLEEIVSEFNRYNRGREFVIGENALRDQRYGGTFEADEPVALIEYLRRTPGLTVTTEENRWVIRSR